jgi:PTH1 family peptidyl-tRNA hydrolase
VMKLVCGLGNPGRAYSRHRHNIGFKVIDELAKRYDVTIAKKAFGAKIGSGSMFNGPVIFAKPQTFMNLSGSAVSPLYGYYKCSLEDLIVVHDDIDLEVGRIKIAKGSGHGGHNGVRSIIEDLGASDFYRVRVGVGRPPVGTDPADYVLSPFSKEEAQRLDDMVSQAADAVEILIEKGLQLAQQRFH